MKTSYELMRFVDKHDLYAHDTGKNVEKKYDFVSSLLRDEETASFAVVCNGVKIKKDKKIIAHYTGTGYFNSGGLLVFTNKRLIVTDYSVPKREPKYHTFQCNINPGEQNWDIFGTQGHVLRYDQVVVRFDNGAEIEMSVRTKKGKHVIEELSQFLTSLR